MGIKKRFYKAIMYNIQNPQNLSLSASESRNRSILIIQSIGDAEPDDHRLGGIG